MGDKILDLGPGTLYFGNVEIGEVISGEYVDESEEHIRAVFKTCFDEEGLTFSATVDFTSVLRILLPNNWLKMHGYPMRRRRFKKCMKVI